MVLGNLEKAFNAQNVKLKLASNEFVTLYNIRKKKSHPRNRVNTRVGAADFYSHPLIEITFDAVVSKDVYSAFTALNLLDARGALPLGAFTVLGENLGGSGGDDISVTFSARVPDLEDVAAEAGHYVIRPTLIIKNSTYSTP